MDNYTACLELLRLYSKKSDKGQRSAFKQVLESDAPKMIKMLWMDEFKTMHPFTNTPLNNSLLDSTSQYLFALQLVVSGALEKDYEAGRFLRYVVSFVGDALRLSSPALETR